MYAAMSFYLKTDAAKCSLAVFQNTNIITFHARDLNLGDITISVDGGATFTPDDVTLDTSLERASLVFAQSFEVGSSLKLHISWKGRFQDNQSGENCSKALNI